MRRREAVARLAAGAAALLAAPGVALTQGGTRAAPPSRGTAGTARGATPRPAVTVYKSESCGCCTDWVKHMEREGFAVAVRNTEDVDGVAAQVGVPDQLRSCHVALAGLYVVSGHVPGDLVRQLLREAGGQAMGLAVPGMPAGTPGMESPRPERYQVIEWRRDGTTRVYASR